MYYTYSIVIIAMSVSSIAWEVYSAKVNETNLRSLAKTEDQVRVLRDGLILTIDTKKLVVGDAVILNNSDSLNGTFKPALVVCDMVIVQGDTVIVDESSLTGESIPVVKAPVPVMESHDEAYSSEKHKRHTLYSGSTITHVKMKPQKQQKDVVDDVSSQNQIGTEDLSKYAIGIVVSTGFYSSKGELLRSILFPKPIDFKFYRDSYVFIGMLSIVALSAFINNLIDGLNESKGFLEVLVSSIDLVTIAGKNYNDYKTEKLHLCS